MSEPFTGERLIPGEVDADLWNEHISRYAFAASFCQGLERVIDAGCGTGYGSHLLSRRAGAVLGIDASPDAIGYAAQRYTGPHLHFLAGLCESMPVASGAANLVVAFEVIEHLTAWRQFLEECARILAPGGVALISTPNKLDYTEARGPAGPNPFHVHEFEFAGFTAELQRVFAHVHILGQNHAESIVFSSPDNAAALAHMAARPADPEHAGFFLAVCSRQPVAAPPGFVYVPASANLLRERERHIHLLQSELSAKDHQLTDLHRTHSSLVRTHRELTAELERGNQWAEALNQQLRQSGERILALQDEVARAVAWAASLDRERLDQSARIVQLREATAALEAEVESRTAWALSRDAELAHCAELLQTAEETVVERTQWALRAEAEAQKQASVVAQYAASRWVKVGRGLHLGPLPR